MHEDTSKSVCVYAACRCMLLGRPKTEMITPNTSQVDLIWWSYTYKTYLLQADIYKNVDHVKCKCFSWADRAINCFGLKSIPYLFSLQMCDSDCGVGCWCWCPLDLQRSAFATNCKSLCILPPIFRVFVNKVNVLISLVRLPYLLNEN